MVIGVIGLGNMGGAIVRGLASSYRIDQILGFDADTEKAKSLSDHMTIALSAPLLARESDIIIIAVKPDTVSALLNEIKSDSKKAIAVSIAAGVTITTMESVLGADAKIIRVMPNTPAMVSEGMTVLSPNKNVSTEQCSHVEGIFSRLGKTLILPEKSLNAVTALSGSGPAYVFTLIQAMADAGVKLGLPRDAAETLAAQTLRGSSSMFLETRTNPIQLRNAVTSPGGTTIAAVHTLERKGWSGIMIDAIEEAYNTAVRLGEKK